jgi:hypothetical protein
MGFAATAAATAANTSGNAAWIPAATAAGTSIGTGLFGWIGAKRARKFAREQSTTAFERDKEMWAMMNAYNHPLAQRKRLEEANLNPSLMYKGLPQNTTQTMPKYNPADQPVYAHKMGFANMYQDLRIKAAQASKLEKEASWMDAEKYQKVVGLHLDNYYKNIKAGLKFEFSRKNMDLVFRQIKVDGSQTTLAEVEANAEIRKKVNDWIISDASAKLSKFNITLQDDPTLRMYLTDMSTAQLLRNIAVLAGGKLVDSAGNLIPRVGFGKLTGKGANVYVPNKRKYPTDVTGKWTLYKGKWTQFK